VESAQRSDPSMPKPGSSSIACAGRETDVDSGSAVTRNRPGGAGTVAVPFSQNGGGGADLSEPRAPSPESRVPSPELTALLWS
jgi:hypothetical protein